MARSFSGFARVPLKTWALLAAVALLAFGRGPAKSSLHWQVIGPGGGGALFFPTISPIDPKRVLVASDMTGAYLSDDAGQSWRTFNLRGRVRFFAFDPHNAEVIYAQSIALWRSTDAGRTWHLLYPNEKNVTALSMANDHAAETILTDKPVGQITALAVDPANSKVLYAGYHRGSSFQIRTSSDWGETWQVSASAPGLVNALYFDPHNGTGYAFGDAFLLVRENNIWQGRPLPNREGALVATSVSFPGSANPVLYVASDSALFLSEDSARSWKAVVLPGSSARIRTIAASPTNPEIVYISYNNLSEGLLSFGKKWFGVARSDNRGRSWQLVWKESDHSAANMHDTWISSVFGPGYAENPIGLSVASSDENLIYSTDYGRVMRSSDGGKNWDAIYSSRLPDGSFAGRGLEAAGAFGVHFDPFDNKRIFISDIDIGLFRSENGGASWVSSINGVPAAWRNNTYWMVFDPDVHGKVWAVMSRVHDLPRTKMWQRKPPSTYDGGVCLSEDGGKSWKSSSTGLPPSAATHILLDPTSPPNARVLYLTAMGRGVYKSVDGGITWALKNGGIEENEPLAWRLARGPDGALYLVIARRSDDGSIGNSGDGAVYQSTDGAEHWARMVLPAGMNGPNGVAVDPRNSRHLLLAAWGRSTPPQAQGGGVYSSFDRGQTWRNVLLKDQHIYDVTVDPRDPKTMYATGFESSAWRSVNSGSTWERIRGFNFKWGHRVIPDPADPDKIYVTTFGGGVWHGPAIGDPEAIDELATPKLAHQR